MRPHPFHLVFGESTADSFPAISDDLEATGSDPHDRDAFVLVGAVGRMLQQLMPPAAPPESIEQHIALLHHGYRFWRHGCRTVAAEADDLQHLIDADVSEGLSPDLSNVYLQFPVRAIWAQLEPDSPHQPLDGCFVAQIHNGLDVLAVFGLHEGRDAFAVVSLRGPSGVADLRAEAVRPDGTPAFASRLPGGEQAGLLSIMSNAELLLLTRLALGFARPPRAA